MDSFVCKIVILNNKNNRILKPKKFDDKRNTLLKFTTASPIKKCLFGVADSKDTDKMLDEQFEIDRMRFNERFGFDLEEIEKLEREDNIENIDINSDNQNSSKRGRKLLKAKRKLSKPNSTQTVMTGMYQFVNTYCIFL